MSKKGPWEELAEVVAEQLLAQGRKRDRMGVRRRFRLGDAAMRLQDAEEAIEQHRYRLAVRQAADATLMLAHAALAMEPD